MLVVLLVIVVINLVVLYYQHRIIQQMNPPNVRTEKGNEHKTETQRCRDAETQRRRDAETTISNKQGAVQSGLPGVAASFLNPNTLQSVADIFKYKAEVSTLATVEKAVEEAGDLTNKCVDKTVNG